MNYYYIFFILLLFIYPSYQVSFTCSPNNITTSYTYVEEYIPSVIEGFGKPSSIIGNSLLVADIENSDSMDLFYHFVRDGSTDNWSLQSIATPSNSSLYEVIEIDRVGRDVVLISTDPGFNTIRMVHVYSYNDSISDFSFRQSLTHSQCIADSYGLTYTVGQATSLKRLAMGSNIIATTCNATMDQQIVVFWMKHFSGTWVEGETVIDITDANNPLNNTSIFMRNDGDLFLVTDPSNNQVDVYRRSWVSNLQMTYSYTIYQPDPANVLFGSTVTCRHVFDDQYDYSGHRDYCVICDRAFNSGLGRCWGYRNMLDFPTPISLPIDSVSSVYNNFGGEGLAIVDPIGFPHILAVSFRNDTYYPYYYSLGAGFTVELFVFDSFSNSYNYLATLKEPSLPGPDLVFFGIDMKGSYNTHEHYLTVSAVSSVSNSSYYNLLNRVFIYNVANDSCCDKSGLGYDVMDTVNACEHLPCLEYGLHSPANLSRDDFNYCTLDSCEPTTSEFERIGGVTHEPIDYNYSIPNPNECFQSTSCGDYGWPQGELNPSCPDPPTECRIFCDEYYGMCGLVDYVFGTGCSYGQCNGFGECFSTQCDYYTDECIGLSCEESRSLVFDALSALMANVDFCLNTRGLSGDATLLNLSVPMTIEMATENNTVSEWIQEANILIHKHSGPCFDYGCNYWTNTVVPDLNRAYEILDELVGMVNCSDAHTNGIHNIECLPVDNGDMWATLKLEDLTNQNEFPDNDINDAVGRFRFCNFREFDTNITVFQWMETHLVAKGSWFTHKIQLTLNGSFSFIYPEIDYEYPYVLMDVDHLISTRVYSRDRSPTSRGWIEDDFIVTMINDTASVLQDTSIVNPLRHDKIVNTGLSTTRCPRFFTRSLIIPSSSTIYPVVSINVPPIYIVLSITPSRTTSIALPSGTTDVAFNKDDFEILLLGMPTGHVIHDSCIYWSLESKNALDVYSGYFDYVTHLKLGGVCDVGGCSDWYYNYVNSSMIFTPSTIVDTFGVCY